jgi:hypothetical protein
MSKVCATCGTHVEREDCHKNRFGEYICRNCQEAGIKFTWKQRLRQLTKTTVRRIVWSLTFTAIAVVFVWMFFNFLARMDS